MLSLQLTRPTGACLLPPRAAFRHPHAAARLLQRSPRLRAPPCGRGSGPVAVRVGPQLAPAALGRPCLVSRCLHSTCRAGLFRWGWRAGAPAPRLPARLLPLHPLRRPDHAGRPGDAAVWRGAEGGADRGGGRGAGGAVQPEPQSVARAALAHAVHRAGGGCVLERCGQGAQAGQAGDEGGAESLRSAVLPRRPVLRIEGNTALQGLERGATLAPLRSLTPRGGRSRRGCLRASRGGAQTWAAPARPPARSRGGRRGVRGLFRAAAGGAGGAARRAGAGQRSHGSVPGLQPPGGGQPAAQGGGSTGGGGRGSVAQRRRQGSCAVVGNWAGLRVFWAGLRARCRRMRELARGFFLVWG